MRFKLLIFSLFLTSLTIAQYRWDYGFGLGASNYLGDMGGKEKTRRDFVADMKLAETRWMVSGFARYKFDQRFALKAELTYLRIQGADNLSSNIPRHTRNLSFFNDIFELTLTPQLTIYENNDLGSSYRFRLGFKTYIFAGVGVFHHNPKTIYKDEVYKLAPLQTEGVKYSLWQMNVPVGMGFYFTMKKKHRIGFEYNWRICFTDYLDDVSGKYASGLTGMSAILANRTNELPAGSADPTTLAYFKPGNKRGDASHKDTYMTVQVNYSYVIRGRSSFYKSRYGSFFFKKTRRKVRKIRAKF
ncbi:MAG TPA: DUF6089 family protein [Bacteroidia bacterium]|jgi:hypothetical protein|nr:DUF6089 family protein [Bacteroidia bacterium]